MHFDCFYLVYVALMEATGPKQHPEADLNVPGVLGLVHSLNNKLGIILAECAMLAQSTNDPKYLMRLATIQKTIHSMADEISRYESKT